MWRRRSFWQLGEYELCGGPMTMQHARAILKHMLATQETQKNPHCEISTMVAPTPTYEPKHLEPYLFFLELENLRETIFTEMNLEEGNVFDGENEINFRVLPGLDECWLWGGNYERPDDNPWVDISIMFRVLVMDKKTGMQVKLYQSTRTCELWATYQLGRLMGFLEKGCTDPVFPGALY